MNSGTEIVGSETAIQRICFRNSSGIFLRDFVTLS